MTRNTRREEQKRVTQQDERGAGAEIGSTQFSFLVNRSSVKSNKGRHSVFLFVFCFAQSDLSNTPSFPVWIRLDVISNTVLLCRRETSFVRSCSYFKVVQKTSAVNSIPETDPGIPYPVCFTSCNSLMTIHIQGAIKCIFNPRVVLLKLD